MDLGNVITLDRVRNNILGQIDDHGTCKFNGILLEKPVKERCIKKEYMGLPLSIRVDVAS